MEKKNATRNTIKGEEKMLFSKRKRRGNYIDLEACESSAGSDATKLPQNWGGVKEAREKRGPEQETGRILLFSHHRCWLRNKLRGKREWKE